MTEAPKILLAHHLKTLKLPTFLREYDKLARQCATESQQVHAQLPDPGRRDDQSGAGLGPQHRHLLKHLASPQRDPLRGPRPGPPQRGPGSSRKPDSGLRTGPSRAAGTLVRQNAQLATHRPRLAEPRTAVYWARRPWVRRRAHPRKLAAVGLWLDQPNVQSKTKPNDNCLDKRRCWSGPIKDLPFTASRCYPT